MVLNEAFFSEKDPSKKSSYQVTANNAYLGKFRSSGIIAATGTGSSGWLYGAKRITLYNIKDILQELKELEKYDGS